MKKVNIMGINPAYLLYKYGTGRTRYGFIIEPLTDQQERILDECNDEKSVSFINHKGDGILYKDVVIYGEIDMDLSKDKNNLRKKLIIPEEGIVINSGVNFETGDVDCPKTLTGEKLIDNGNLVSKQPYRIKVPAIYQTWDILLAIKYANVIIGNPKKVIIYKKLL